MDRRTLLKNIYKFCLLASPFGSRLLRGSGSSLVDDLEPTLVLIHDSTSLTETYRPFLDRLAPYLDKHYPEWPLQLALWDRKVDSKAIRSLLNKYGKNTRELKLPVLINIPDSIESDGEVELWSPEWLDTLERRAMDACYPISGGWWSVEGDWNPSISKVRNHVNKSPNHSGGKFNIAWLDLLNFEELQSLHSDHHREMTNKGKVHWKNVNTVCPENRIENRIG